jgi:two-component system sensor histidine kinase BaeS
MRTLTLKLILAFLLVGLTGAVLVAFFVGQRTGSEFERFLIAQQRERLVAELGDLYSETGDWRLLDQRLRSSMRSDGRLFALATVLDADGRYVAGRRPRIEDGRPLRPEIADPILADGEMVGYLLVDLPDPRRTGESPEAAFRDSVRRAVMLSALGATLAALIVGIALARTITRPVRELTAATQELAAGELGLQVPVRGCDELNRLAGSFNAMSSDLAEATRLRRQMTADIAHDLRTPLSVILGYAEALSEGKLDGSQAIFDVMHGEARHLNRLIDDLRLLSLAEAGELSLNLQDLNPQTLLTQATSAYAIHADDAGIELVVDACASLCQVLADPERMAQVLGNLVSNALRHTPPGGRITLGAAQSDDTLVLTVTDTGEGIDFDDLPHIFARFYRGDAARSAEGESGLGLPIAKSLVEAQGGTLGVTSEPGGGATFRIEMPCSLS